MIDDLKSVRSVLAAFEVSDYGHKRPSVERALVKLNGVIAQLEAVDTDNATPQEAT